MSLLLAAVSIVASRCFADVPNEKLVVYSGATLIDGTGAPPKSEMAIVTKGERIVEVVPVGELRTPDGAELVEVKGSYVVPGLINAHEHLATPPDRRFAEAMMRRDLYGGVTAVRCMGDRARSARVSERKRGVQYPRSRYRPIEKSEVENRM